MSNTLKLVIEIQLLWSTWDSVCEVVGSFMNGTKGEYVDGFGNISDPSTNKIGLFYNNNFEGWLIQEGDWIIRDGFGRISFLTNKEYNRLKKIQYIDMYETHQKNK